MLEKYRYSETNKRKILDSIVYLIDTREKKIDHIINLFEKHNLPYMKRKLDYGDYSFYIPKNPELGIFEDMYFDHEVIIERKANLEELSQNLTKLRQQFKHEMSMAPARKVLLIENNNYSDLVRHNYDTQYDQEYYLDTLHRYSWRYGFHFFFINKDDTARYIKRYFETYVKEMLR